MYTSGRTVKSSKAQQSPIAAATATGRRLAKRYLPETATPQVSSKLVGGMDGMVRMQTTILFCRRSLDATKPLADAIAALPGYSSMAWNLVSISYLIELA